MSNNIQLHKNDLPDDLKLGNIIAVDGEFMGLNFRRDPLSLVQISTGNSDAHIIQFDRKKYNAPCGPRACSRRCITFFYNFIENFVMHLMGHVVFHKVHYIFSIIL